MRPIVNRSNVRITNIKSGVDLFAVNAEHPCIDYLRAVWLGEKREAPVNGKKVKGVVTVLCYSLAINPINGFTFAS
jgi:hypothetical protein